MLTTNSTLHAIHRAWLAADAAMMAALVRTFGKQACNRRYDPTKSGWSADAIAAGLDFDRLRDAYNTELARMRKAA